MACIASPQDVSKNFELCCISCCWRLSIYNFQTWAASDFVPIEGQLVVFLALTGQMSHTRVWLGKYNPSLPSRASPDPVRPYTTDCTGIPKPAWHPHGTVWCKTERADVPMPVCNPLGHLGCPHVNLAEPVRYMYGILQPRDQRTHRFPIERRMHVTTTTRNAYEWSRAVGLGEPYGHMTIGKSV